LFSRLLRVIPDRNLRLACGLGACCSHDAPERHAAVRKASPQNAWLCAAIAVAAKMKLNATLSVQNDTQQSRKQAKGSHCGPERHAMVRKDMQRPGKQAPTMQAKRNHCGPQRYAAVRKAMTQNARQTQPLRSGKKCSGNQNEAKSNHVGPERHAAVQKASTQTAS